MRALGKVAIGMLPIVAFTGCTFLITFDDVPADATTRDAAADRRRDTAPAPTDTALPERDAGFQPATCDESFPLGQLTCADFIDNGMLCGTNFKSYPGGEDPSRDLVTCGAGDTVRCVKHCRTTCLPMPDPRPDQCADCGNNPSGTYCGRDMPGWEAANSDVLVACEGGRATNPIACAAGCDSKGATGSAACR